jgi:hypothetical protein
MKQFVYEGNVKHSAWQQACVEFNGACWELIPVFRVWSSIDGFSDHPHLARTEGHC